MKSIQQHINERLHLTKDRVSKCKYFPKTKPELEKIIKQLFDENGYNVDLNIIDTSKITDMSYLFDNTEFHKFCGDVSQWNVSNVENMDSLFFGCYDFDCDLSQWNVSQVKDMEYMFGACENFKGRGLEKWDVSRVKNMGAMFAKCENLNCDLSHWNVSQVINMQHMFYLSNFSNDISSWKIKSNAATSKMFLKSPLENNPPVWYKDI